MQDNNIPYIQIGSFIKMNSDILPIFVCEQATKDTINILTYILNDLNLLYNNKGQLLEEKTYILTQGEVINILHYDAINKKKKTTIPREKVNGKWIYKQVITVLQELIHRVNGLVLLTDNGMKYTPLASSIEFVENEDTYLVTIKLNPQFLEVYNQLLQAGEGYYQILSDILVSLPDMKSQILWALICRYRYQLRTHGQTNPTYLKSLREYMSFAGVPKKMSATNFISAMNTSMNKINRLILERNKELSDDEKESTYKIEFIKESVMKQPNRTLAQYEKFQILIDEEPPKTKPTPEQNKPTTNKPKQVVKKPKYENEIAEIVEYLNMKADKNFKATSKDTIKYITQRLNEGYTVKDCKYVIDVKVAEWKNDNEMNMYLRPSTLFNSEKFEGYLNQSMPKKKIDVQRPKQGLSVEDIRNGIGW